MIKSVSFGAAWTSTVKGYSDSEISATEKNKRKAFENSTPPYPFYTVEHVCHDTEHDTDGFILHRKNSSGTQTEECAHEYIQAKGNPESISNKKRIAIFDYLTMKHAQMTNIAEAEQKLEDLRTEYKKIREREIQNLNVMV